MPSDTEALRSAAATHAVYGIPIDGTTLLRTGSMYGPRAVRDASSRLVSYHTDHDLDLSDHLDLVDCGDVEVVPGNAARTFANARADLAAIYAADVMPIVLGGEHSVTIPAAAALADATPHGRLGLVNFDSHFDTSVDVLGERLTHCSPITRALETGRYRPQNTVLLGIHGCGNPRAEHE
ncbi:MAG: arginase family protein [Actinobacteria bacterium]|nr:arginase family protein [Actinomycetota bacterium]